MLNLEKESNTLLCLIQAALHPDFEQAENLTSGCNMEKLAVMIEKQSLVTMVYPVILRQTDACWMAIKEYLKPIYDREIHKGLVQEYEIQSLLDAMEKDGIDCLPMKGWIMRDYYPDPLMRSMGDLDVLIKNLDSQKMQKWMEARGYKAVKVQQQFHDEYQKSPYMYVELHRKLVDESGLQQTEVEKVRELTKNLWIEEDLADGKKHIYQLRNEMFYIHYLLHFYKHFTSSGAGIRFLTDNYVFLKQKEKTLDKKYLRQQLETLQLVAFAERIKQITYACFEGGTLTAQDILILEYLTGTGVHGSQSIWEASYTLNQGEGSFIHNKRCSFWNRCFPPLTNMQNRYTKLYRWPFLLPAYYVIRIGRILFQERNKLIFMRKTQTKEQYERLLSVYRAAGVIKKP